MDILREIIAHKRQEIDARKAGCPVEVLQAALPTDRDADRFVAALRSAPMGLIAEVKHRSPSAGTIRDPFEPARIARAYAEAGAQAISVLIDEHYFGGGAGDLVAVQESCEVALLYKEFVVDAWQVWHAASLGASAVLLIAAALDDQEFANLLAACRAASVSALVEVHDGDELDRAAAAGAVLIGVNNRNLRTFEVSLDTSVDLAARAPASATLVSESGIRGPADVARVKAAGYHAVLVGEHLLRQADLVQAVEELMGDVWASS